MLSADCLRVRYFHQKSNWFVKKHQILSAPTQFFKISSCGIPRSQNLFNCLQKMIQIYTAEKHTYWKNTSHKRYKSFKEMPLKVRILDIKTRHQSNQHLQLSVACTKNQVHMRYTGHVPAFFRVTNANTVAKCDYRHCWCWKLQENLCEFMVFQVFNVLVMPLCNTYCMSKI